MAERPSSVSQKRRTASSRNIWLALALLAVALAGIAAAGRPAHGGPLADPATPTATAAAPVLPAATSAAHALPAATSPSPVIPAQAGIQSSPAVSGAAAQSLPLNDRLGIAHISYGAQPATAERYRQATTAGVGWNRWVAYWHEIERNQGVFDYSRHDATIRADREHGLQLAVVLMGTPGFYATTTAAQTQSFRQDVTPAASAPRNLDRPVFADGSDTLAPGKAINPDNYWARFVANTVARYKGAVRYWEMWNEPDFSTFWWTGDGQEVKHYARLLKVGYLAAKSVDPDAQVLLGGLMSWEWRHRTGSDTAWLRALLTEMAADPNHGRYSYYFDILPLHWYSRSADLYDKTMLIRRFLADNGVPAKPIWTNETNIGVCGDPQTGGKPDCTPGVPKGRPDEQAAFILQAAANAFAAGVEKFFAFQLYDDGVKPFDYYGLIRNDGSHRPAYAAYQVAARYFRDIVTAERVQVAQVDLVTMATREGRTVKTVWNNGPEALTVAIPARAANALLVDQRGEARAIHAQSGSYILSLPGATLSLDPTAAKSDYLVGGLTYVLVEEPDPAAMPAAPTPTATATATATVTPTASATPTATPTPQPTTTVTATATLSVPVSSRSTPSALPAPPPLATTSAFTQTLETASPISATVAPTLTTTPVERTDLRIPADLSTVRVSDVTGDQFTLSWVSGAPTTATVRCGTSLPLADLAEDVRGPETRSVTHFVTVRHRQPNTTYLCAARAGVEVDDNGGAYFAVTTLPSSTATAPRSLTGLVVDDRGRPRAAALVYATIEGVAESPGGAAVFTALSDPAGRWTLDLPAAMPADSPVRLTAIASTGLAARQIIGAAETLTSPLRLRFTWTPYETAVVSLQPGWNDLSLPLRPLNPLTVDDLAREVATQRGRVSEVYWYEDGQWQGGPVANSRAPLVFGRRYVVKADLPATWTIRGETQ